MQKPEYRQAKNTCYCRACDRKMLKNVDWGAFFYSFRNCGQHISLCRKCVLEMAKIVDLPPECVKLIDESLSDILL